MLGFHGLRYQHNLSAVRYGEKYSTEGSITVNNDEKRANNWKFQMFIEFASVWRSETLYYEKSTCMKTKTTDKLKNLHQRLKLRELIEITAAQ